MQRLRNLRSIITFRMDKKEYIDEFISTCRDLGIARGDIVYISSDVTGLTLNACRKCRIKGKAEINTFYDELVDALRSMVGEEGTLLFPVFTWDFCRGKGFDVKTTQGEVGALGNWVLNNRSDFVRTEHPLYSFMVCGKDASMLADLHNRSAWASDSPFAYMYENKAKSLLIGTTLEDCFTFAHFVEENIGVPFRYYKDFHGKYTDKDSRTSDRTYTMYVRDLDIDSSQVTPDDCLIDAGVSQRKETNGISVEVVDLAASYPYIEENYRKNNFDQWYDFKGYVVDWEAGQTHPDETTMSVSGR